MYDLRQFHQRVTELYRRARIYDDSRRPTQRDLADAVGLSLAELNKRLNGKQATRLTDRDARAIVRTLADWEVISTRQEASELLALVDCPPFTAAEWAAPPLDRLTENGSTHLAPNDTQPSALRPQHSALPIPLTSFVGREREMRQLAELVPAHRLVTLLGPGGAGKTRLALEAASRLALQFGGAVYLVELAGLNDPVLVAQAVAKVLDVREQPDEPLADTLTLYLRPREALLILDNAEHLIGAVAELAQRLLRACGRLHLVVTSRERLRVAGERRFDVPPLTLPPSGATLSPAALSDYEAVCLFIERAKAAWPDFALTAANADAVRTICERLDGLPLAIELAAACVALMNVDELAARLADRFRLLNLGDRTAQPRQQTLTALVDWSYDLLTAAEQTLLRRLTVFAAPFTLEAAEAVCTDPDLPPTDILPLLGQLLDKSLIVRSDSRCRLLETIRDYASAKLIATADGGPQCRHAIYYLNLAERAAAQLLGEQQVIWLARLEQEHDNFRAALAWALDAGEIATALRLATALWRFWYSHGYLREGRGWLGAALARTADLDLALRARALNGAGSLAWSQGDYAEARTLYEQSLALHRELDDQQSITNLLSNLGNVARAQGNYDEARALYEQSLAIDRELDDSWRVARSLSNLGLMAYEQGDYPRAQTLLEEALAYGGDRVIAANALNILAELAQVAGEDARATDLYDASLALYRELGIKEGEAMVLNNLGTFALHRSDYPTARRLLRDSLTLLQQLGDKLGLANVLAGFAELAANTGQPRRAARLYAAADALRHAMGVPLPAAEQANYDRACAASQAALDPSIWAAEQSIGRTMPLDEVISYTLSHELAQIAHKSTHFLPPHCI